MSRKERRAYILQALEEADRMWPDGNDGAWFGYIMVEKGIDVEELPHWNEKYKGYLFKGEEGYVE